MKVKEKFVGSGTAVRKAKRYTSKLRGWDSLLTPRSRGLVHVYQEPQARRKSKCAPVSVITTLTSGPSFFIFGKRRNASLALVLPVYKILTEVCINHVCFIFILGVSLFLPSNIFSKRSRFFSHTFSHLPAMLIFRDASKQAALYQKAKCPPRPLQFHRWKIDLQPTLCRHG